MEPAQNTFGAAYAIGAVYLFFLFSHASEFIDTRGTLHLVVLAAFAASIAALSCGMIPSTLASKPGMALSAFTALLILSIPFSSWKGNSFHNFMDVWWKSYVALILCGALIFSVRQMRKSLFVLAIGTIGIIYFSFKATKMNDDGRLSVEYGSLGNSNDLGSALLVGLPFLVYVVMDKKRAALIRVFFLGLVGLLMSVLLKTGSRSGLLVLGAMAVFVFFRADAKTKLILVVLCGMAAVAVPLVAGKTLMNRYRTMFETEVTSSMSEDTASAVLSSQARRQLFYNGIELTLRHPIFGVGLANFRDQSADLMIAKGDAPLWFTCHDIYLLISSETGVIGFLLYAATILFSIGTLLRIGKAAKLDPEMAELGSMSATLFMAFVAFIGSGIFSTNAYAVEMPLLAGLTIALDRIAKPLLASSEARRLEKFRQSIPTRPSRHAAAAAAALALR